MGLRFVNASPLKKSIGRKLRDISLIGAMKFGLTMKMPLSDSVVEKDTQVEGDIELDNNQLSSEDWGLELDKLCGKLHFNNDDLVASNIKGELFGKVINLDIKTLNPDSSDVITKINLIGKANVEDFKKALKRALLSVDTAKENKGLLPSLVHVFVDEHIDIWARTPLKYQYRERINGNIINGGCFSLSRETIKKINFSGEVTIRLEKKMLVFEDSSKKLLISDSKIYPCRDFGFNLFSDDNKLSIGYLKVKEIKQIFKRTVNYLSNDVMSPVLRRVFLDFPNRNIVATDGHKLVVLEVQLECNKTMLVEFRMSLVNSFADDKSVADIFVGDEAITFRVNSDDKFHELVLINDKDRYVDYERVFPNVDDAIEKKKIGVDKLKDFVKAVKEQNIKDARFILAGSDVIIKGLDIKAELKGLSFFKNNIAFNLDVFEDGISALTDGEAELFLYSDKLLILADDCRCLIMPIRYDEDAVD